MKPGFPWNWSLIASVCALTGFWTLLFVGIVWWMP